MQLSSEYAPGHEQPDSLERKEKIVNARCDPNATANSSLVSTKAASMVDDAGRATLRIGPVLLLTCAFIASLAAAHTSRAANGSVVYTYDALGRITTASYDTGVIIVYTYDANGNRLSQTINMNTTNGVWGSFNWSAAKWSP